jgi:hypothetical protein
VKRRVAELTDQKNRTASANNEPLQAKKTYQKATKNRKRRQKNLVDDYYLWGIGYGTGLSGDRSPFLGHVVIPANLGIMVFHDQATFDFTATTGIMSKVNQTWAEHALQVPAGTLNTSNSNWGFSEVVSLGLCPVLVNKRNIALTAGVFGGFNFFLIPSLDFGVNNASVSGKLMGCYGIKSHLFLGENFAAFMNLAFSASRTADVAPYYGDPYKVATNFNTFNIGIAVRTDTWW